MIASKVIKEHLRKAVFDTETLSITGRISRVTGSIIESTGPKAPVGEICKMTDRFGNVLGRSEIVGFIDEKTIQSMPLGSIGNISPGTRIISTGRSLEVPVGDNMLGRIIDSLCYPIDGKGPVATKLKRSIYADPPNPLARKPITEVLETGIRAVDGMLTIGKGQRVGIFSGSGVGKSTLLGMTAKYTNADVNVIALIGERGREVREFIDNELGEYGLARSVVVVATGDQSPLLRVKAAYTATTIAEHFRDQGLDVMLMMDSVTRLAMAQREVGLSIGEPPTTKGYTPSVINVMQGIMERAGTSDTGSITALYSVLVEGDDLNEPISDTARGILDGHIVLSRKLASMGHYPAIDVLESISRLRNKIVTPEHLQAALALQKVMSAYRTSEDLINVGAYQRGSNPLTDKAIAGATQREDYLTQPVEEKAEFEDTVNQLMALSK